MVLGGKADWRLPSVDELGTIIDYSRSLPTIAPVFSCRWTKYWSGSTDLIFGLDDNGGKPMMNQRKRISFALLFVFALTFPVCSFAVHLHPEAWYVDIWCPDHNGTVEVVLSDKTRVDCLTATTAIEFDFADKWYEAVGQSLHYGKMTQKKAGIVLIVETQNDLKYWNRLVAVKKYWGLKIALWKYTPEIAE